MVKRFALRFAESFLTHNNKFGGKQFSKEPEFCVRWTAGVLISTLFTVTLDPLLNLPASVFASVGLLQGFDI